MRVGESPQIRPIRDEHLSSASMCKMTQIKLITSWSSTQSSSLKLVNANFSNQCKWHSLNFCGLWSWNQIIINKMQCTSAAVGDLKSVKFAYSAGTEDWIYIHFVVAHFCGQCKWKSFTFTCMHLADAFSQSNLQKRNRAINQRANNHCNNANLLENYIKKTVSQKKKCRGKCYLCVCACSGIPYIMGSPH